MENCIVGMLLSFPIRWSTITVIVNKKVLHIFFQIERYIYGYNYIACESM